MAWESFWGKQSEKKYLQVERRTITCIKKSGSWSDKFEGLIKAKFEKLGLGKSRRNLWFPKNCEIVFTLVFTKATFGGISCWSGDMRNVFRFKWNKSPIRPGHEVRSDGYDQIQHGDLDHFHRSSNDPRLRRRRKSIDPRSKPVAPFCNLQLNIW